MRRLTMLVVVALALACATEKAWMSVTPMKTQADFYSDRSECLSKANAVQAPSAEPCFSGSFLCGYQQGQQAVQASEAQERRNTIFHGCMVGRGWSLQEKH